MSGVRFRIRTQTELKTMPDDEQLPLPESTKSGSDCPDEAVPEEPPPVVDENEDPQTARAEPVETEPEKNSWENSFQALAARLDEMRTILVERLNDDRTKEQAFERLYAELDNAKEDRIYDLLHPSLFDLILLYDRIEAYTRNDGPEDNSRGFLESVLEEIVEILARREVEVIDTSTGAFDPSLQKAIGVQETTEPDDHHGIASVVRRGFRRRERIVRAEEVIVMKHVPRTVEPGEEETG